MKTLESPRFPRSRGSTPKRVAALALARIAARLIATRAWERRGFARLADYARERTGLSARQLQDLAHTSARLEALPATNLAPAAANLCAAQGADWVAPLLAELESADAFELDTRLWRAVAEEQRLHAELAPLLRFAPEEHLTMSHG